MPRKTLRPGWIKGSRPNYFINPDTGLEVSKRQYLKAGRGGLSNEAYARKTMRKGFTAATKMSDVRASELYGKAVYYNRTARMTVAEACAKAGISKYLYAKFTKVGAEASQKHFDKTVEKLRVGFIDADGVAQRDVHVTRTQAGYIVSYLNIVDSGKADAQSLEHFKNYKVTDISTGDEHTLCTSVSILSEAYRDGYKAPKAVGSAPFSRSRQ